MPQDRNHLEFERRIPHSLIFPGIPSPSTSSSRKASLRNHSEENWVSVMPVKIVPRSGGSSKIQKEHRQQNQADMSKEELPDGSGMQQPPPDHSCTTTDIVCSHLANKLLCHLSGCNLQDERQHNKSRQVPRNPEKILYSREMLLLAKKGVSNMNP